MIQRFEINPHAQALHDEGLKLANQQDFRLAYEAFSRARYALPWNFDDPSVRLQQARITRDSSMTQGEHALRDSATSQARIDYAFRGAQAALRATTEVQAGEELSDIAKRYLLSEHGATLMVLGKLAAIEEELDIKASDGLNGQSAPYYFDHAAGFLAQGSNRRYEDENFAYWARYEWKHGQPKRAARTIGWGMVRSITTLVSDPDSYGNSPEVMLDELANLTKQGLNRRKNILRERLVG